MYIGILEVYLDMEAHISSATQVIKKGQKKPQKERGISLTIMGQRSIYHGDHLHRMCNETGIPEFLEFQIPGIPVVAIVTSRTCSLHDPTKQDFIHERTLPIYKCHTRFKF